MSIKRKVRVSRDGERVYGKGVQKFGCLNLGRRRALTTNLRQAVGDEENKNNKGAVGRALDLKVSE